MARRLLAKRARPRPKTVLRLPDLDQAKSAVLNSLSSIDAQRGYRHAIDEFVEWYCSEPRLSFSRTVVLRYGTQGGADLAFYTYMGGPRFRLHRGRASLFAHALFGVGGLTANAGGVSATENAFATALGTGVDVRVAPRLAVRVIQADYVLSRLAGNTQNNLRFSTGLVFRLAGAKNAN